MGGTGGDGFRVVTQGLTRRYPRGVVALDNVHLEIGEGLFGLLGPNGAGKTTLMRILATLLPPTAGRVSVGPYEVRRDQHEIRQILGYLPQEFGLYRRLTVGEVLEYVAGLKGIAPGRRRAEVDHVIETTHLGDVRRRAVGALSGGMKRRLGIAQALLGSPRLLIVDEPTAGLDPEERIRFRNLLSELGRRRVVILSTHVVADVESIALRVGVLNRGQLVFCGDPDGLRGVARGLVWELWVPDERIDCITRPPQGIHPISTRMMPGGAEVRLLSPQGPWGEGRPARHRPYRGGVAATGPQPARGVATCPQLPLLQRG
ncbi:MAG TPA: ABC transporter ATP-binding protein [Firmicutes bacterium]|nr:ABC transporter ATP-binding protein [Bacillota bacterium]